MFPSHCAAVWERNCYAQQCQQGGAWSSGSDPLAKDAVSCRLLTTRAPGLCWWAWLVGLPWGRQVRTGKGKGFLQLFGILASSHGDGTRLDMMSGSTTSCWQRAASTHLSFDQILSFSLWNRGTWAMISPSFCGNSPGHPLFPSVSRNQLMFSSNYSIPQLNINAIQILWECTKNNRKTHEM